MSEGHQDQQPIAVRVTAVTGGGQELLDLGLGQVLTLPVLGVLAPTAGRFAKCCSSTQVKRSGSRKASSPEAPARSRSSRSRHGLPGQALRTAGVLTVSVPASRKGPRG